MMKSIKLLFALVGIVITASLSAQTYTPSLENDTIAIGSQAKYKVNLFYKDSINNPLLNVSGVKWTFPTGYTAVDFTQIDGVTALVLGADGAYNQQEIVMKAKLPLGGGLTLSAQELSRPLAGAGCVGGITTKGIVVIAMPTATYGPDSGGCALPLLNLNVPVNFTGNGKYDVSFAVQAYDLSNTAVGGPVAITKTGLVNARTSETAKLHYVSLPIATFVALPAGGHYQIKMSNLQDRISEKTLNYVFGTTDVANPTPDSGDADGQYRFYIYPAPVTQPIQHVRNY